MRTFRRTLQALGLVLIMHISAKAQTCNCKANFDSLVNSIERNYSGFFDKTSGNQIKKYTRIRANLRKQSTLVGNYDCYLLMRNYLAYFNDPHLQISFGSPGQDSKYNDTLRAMFKKFKSIALDSSYVYNYLQHHSIDKIEGIWQAVGFPFKVAIIRNKSKPAQFVTTMMTADSIRWFKGQTKMVIDKVGKGYRVAYFKSDHLPDTVLMNINNGYFDISPYGSWQRIYPTESSNFESEPSVGFSQPAPDVSMITLKDGWIDNRPLLDSIIGANKDRIDNTPYLIIDLRGNTGGHIMTYEPLYPFIYTKPILTDGLVVRASEDNITIYKEDLDSQDYSEAEIKGLKEITDTMERNVGKMIKVSDADSIVINDTKVFPKKVGIITNRKTASASELFILFAKQGGKVTVFGQPTRGELDYTDWVKRRKLPCPYLEYQCPTSTSEHNHIPLIDNVGIMPDKVIDATDENCVSLVIKELKKL